MSSASVRAGRAHVELGVRDQLQKGLDAAQKRLKAFATSAAKIGAVVSAAGAAVLAPLMHSVYQFAAAGDAADKMAARTGLSTKAVSELAYAAAQSGTSIETVESRIHRLQLTLAQASQGSQSARDALSALGLSARALQSLTPDEQLSALADRLSQIEDPTTRNAAAMAILGRSATALMPLLSGGADGLAALRAEAKQLGLSLDDHAIAAGARFGDALARIKSAVTGVQIQIGAALAPSLTDLAERIWPVIAVTAQWIRDNQQLIKTAAVIGAALVTAGAAIAGLATGALVLKAVLAGVATMLSAGAVVLGAILSPIGLAVTAVLAAGTAFIRFTDQGQQMWARAKEIFGTLFEWIKQVFGGIAKAVAAGDLSTAAAIAWAAVQVVIATAVDWIANKLDALRGYFGDTFGAIVDSLRAGDLRGAVEIAMGGMIESWNNGIASLLGSWGDYLRSVVQTFAGIVQEISRMWIQTQGGISKGILGIAEKSQTWRERLAEMLGLSPETLKKAQSLGLGGGLGMLGLTAEQVTGPQTREMAEQAKAQIDEQNAQRHTAVEDKIGSTLTAFDRTLNRWTDEARARADAARDAQAARVQTATIRDADAHLADLLKKAAQLERPKPPDLKLPDLKLPALPDLDESLEYAANLPTIATSSSYAIQALFGGLAKGPEEETAKNTARAADLLRELNDRDKLRPRQAQLAFD